MRTRSFLVIVATVFGFAFAGVQSIHATTLTVTKTADTNDGVCNADCSLREAIAAANDSDTINFSVTGAITLGSGELAIGKNITISGPGALNLAVDGNHAGRVFHILPGKTVTISDLTIRNGSFTNSSGIHEGGGGIYNNASTLTLNNCAITGNTSNGGPNADGFGGGIYSDTKLGPSAGANASVTLKNCTVNGNTAQGSQLHLGKGGGIAHEGTNGATATLNITNSTISGNTAINVVTGGRGLGGGIYSFGQNNGDASITVTSSTFSNNNAGDFGASIYLDDGTTLTMGNTILNAGAPGNIGNSGNPIVSLGYNLSNDNAGLNGPGDQNNVNPQLGPLQNNGGQTSTHAPLCGSPAIDQGKNFNGVSTDQRGAARTVDLPAFASFSGGDATDVGAVESPVRTFAVTKPADTNDGTCNADCSLREAIAAANASSGIDLIALPASGVPINVSAGELLVTDCAAINGLGASLVTVSGNNNSRVFHVAPAIAVSFFGMTIVSGNVGAGFGGAILNDHAMVAVDSCVIGSNTAGFGGAIYNDGSTNGGNGGANFTLRNSTLSGNTASNGGGGIFNYAQNTGESGGTFVTLTVLNSTLNNNTATNFGGGIQNYGVGTGANGLVTITNSTLSANSASAGGGIYNVGDFGNGTVTINNSTLSGNTASSSGGAVYTTAISGSGALNTANTIYNAGASGGTIFGGVNSSGYNLASDNGGGNLNGTGDMINTNPQLGGLQNNGGPTATHALGTNSPAREHGNPNFDPNAFNPPMIYDQRGFGFPRVLNRLDIGAFELPAPLAFVRATSAALHTSPPNPPFPPTVLPFEINLPLSGSPGIECRSSDAGPAGGGVPGRHNIFFYFPNQISSTTNATVSCGTVSFVGSNGNPISVEFDGASCNQQYVTVTLNGIQDSYGQTLASASVVVGLLLGDTTGNGSVTSSDVSQTKFRSGQSLDASNFRSDVTVDVSINSSDVSLVKLASGTALP